MISPGWRVWTLRLANVLGAWHEWGHALSVVRCEPAEVARGRELLDVEEALLQDAALLASEGIGPAWPGLSAHQATERTASRLVSLCL